MRFAECTHNLFVRVAMMHQENKANKRQRLQHHQGAGVGSASGEGEGGLGRHPHAYATRGGGHGRFPQQTIGMGKGATSSTATRPSINLMNLVNVKGSSQSLLHHLLSEIGEDMPSQWAVRKSSQEQISLLSHAFGHALFGW